MKLNLVWKFAMVSIQPTHYLCLCFCTNLTRLMERCTVDCEFAVLVVTASAAALRSRLVEF